MADPRYAESRWTRGPIHIGPFPGYIEPGEGMTGTNAMPEYDAVNPMKWRFPYGSPEREFIEKGIPKDRGAMYVYPDPEATDEQNSTLFKHEAVHNLLSNTLGKDDEDDDLRKLRQMHQSPRLKPYADKAKAEFTKAGWMGEPELEVPAYLGTNDLQKLGSSKVGITPEERKAYMVELLRLLQRTNPDAAKTLSRMSGVVVGEK